MKKAKTNKKIYTIFSAILGVVFAFITGVTYCLSSMVLTYTSQEKSASAYLANQDYHIINDTIQKPVVFGEGNHNFEIALQYSFGYDFDVRFAYALTWQNSTETNPRNVILNFANRDNIIYDENYIYLASGVTKGNGKISIITGVEFTDPADENYFGGELTISVTAKVYKKLASTEEYTTNHYLCLENNTSKSALAWVEYKERSKTTYEGTTAYAMVYNRRYDYNNGVPYSGLNTAYEKPVATEEYTTEIKDAGGNTSSVTIPKDRVYGENWLGGNRAYAGVGMYVIAGSEDVMLEVKVSGIWLAESLGDTSQFISENSIKLNYSANWLTKDANATQLWETRTYKYYVKAHKACYIPILDSVEIVSAGRTQTNLYDSYRLAINKVTINPSWPTLEENLTAQNHATEVSYSDIEREIENVEFKINSNLTASTDNSNKDISVVNTSVYSNGLYNISTGGEQSFNTNISLINNTADTKTVNVTYDLYYRLSNGEVQLFDTTTGKKSEYLGLTDVENLNSALFFTYEVKNNNLLKTIATTKVTIAPYSSVALTKEFTVTEDLKTIISALDDETTTKIHEYYDAWVYVVANPSVAKTAETKENLAIETSVNNGVVSIYAKNNTNKIINGATITNLSIRKYVEGEPSPLISRPNDWRASYWKYYEYKQGSNVLTPVTSNTLSEGATFPTNTYYEISKTYELAVITKGYFDLTGSGSVYSGSTTNQIKPGERLLIGTANISSQFIVDGSIAATTSSAMNELMIVENGTDQAYIINASTKSYHLRFNGSTTTTGQNISRYSGYDYYMGIVRPGQVISVKLTSMATLSIIEVDNVYDESKVSDWANEYKSYMNNVFSFVKTA